MGNQFHTNRIPISFLFFIVSLLAFYFLYKILNGNEKSIVWLAIIVALTFHVHLTVAIFIPIIIILTLPFFPINKKTLKYILVSIPILFIGLSPVIVANLQSNNHHGANAINYANATFHGISLTRILQLKDGAFFQLESFLTLGILRFLRIVLLPIFLFVYLRNTASKKRFAMTGMVSLWFLVPWIVLSGYSGEITDYYFSTNRYIGIFLIAYLVVKLLEQKKFIITSALAIFSVYYSIVNLSTFFNSKAMGLSVRKNSVRQTIEQKKVIPFKEGNAESYIYYFYTRKK